MQNSTIRHVDDDPIDRVLKVIRKFQKQSLTDTSGSKTRQLVSHLLDQLAVAVSHTNSSQESANEMVWESNLDYMELLVQISDSIDSLDDSISHYATTIDSRLATIKKLPKSLTRRIESSLECYRNGLYCSQRSLRSFLQTKSNDLSQHSKEIVSNEQLAKLLDEIIGEFQEQLKIYNKSVEDLNSQLMKFVTPNDENVNSTAIFVSLLSGAMGAAIGASDGVIIGGLLGSLVPIPIAGTVVGATGGGVISGTIGFAVNTVGSALVLLCLLGLKDNREEIQKSVTRALNTIKDARKSLRNIRRKFESMYYPSVLVHGTKKIPCVPSFDEENSHYQPWMNGALFLDCHTTQKQLESCISILKPQYIFALLPHEHTLLQTISKQFSECTVLSNFHFDSLSAKCFSHSQISDSGVDVDGQSSAIVIEQIVSSSRDDCPCIIVGELDADIVKVIFELDHPLCICSDKMDYWEEMKDLNEK